MIASVTGGSKYFEDETPTEILPGGAALDMLEEARRYQAAAGEVAFCPTTVLPATSTS